MKIIDRGTVVRARKDSDMSSCCFPTVCAQSDGRWICGFRMAPTKNGVERQNSYISFSDDEGKTWSEPFAPFSAKPVYGKPGVFRGVQLTSLGAKSVLAYLYWVESSDMSLPFFNEKTEGLLDSKLFLSRSDDGGITWLEPEWIDTIPITVPTPFTGPILVLPNGDWALQIELNKHYYDTTAWRHASVLMFSKDKGRTWKEYSVTSNDPENKIFYWDQRPGILSDGTILDVFWTYDNKNAKYLNVHARESKDNARTWSALWDTGLPGQPAAPVSLSDGRIALVYVDREGAPVIKCRTSKDNGRTWQKDTEIIVYEKELKTQTEKKGRMQDAWSEMGKFSIGLPATTLLGNGDILVAYYAGDEMNVTDIHWTRLRG